MNDELSVESREILSQSDRFAREQLYPLQQKMDDEEWWPDDVFPRLGEIGYLGVTVPEIYGGAGLDFFSSTLILQSITKWNPAVGFSYGTHDNLCVNNLLRNGNEDQHARHLPDLCSGRKTGALALTEPGAGSDAIGSMRTTARREGDTYLLNGSKQFITNGPIADVVLVYAKTRAQDNGPERVSAFIVERAFEGFASGKTLRKMGYRGSPTSELVFSDCRVPAENLLGEEHRGISVLMSGLDLERAFLAVSTLGLGERALELSLDYATTREQFGQPIGNFQLIQAKLAEMYTSLEACRAFAYRVARACNDLRADEGGRGEIHKLSAAAALFCAQQTRSIVDHAVQIHGGSGFMWETEVNRLYRAARALEIGAGTSEIRKMIIAGELTGS